MTRSKVRSAFSIWVLTAIWAFPRPAGQWHPQWLDVPKHFVKTARVRHAPFTDACDLLPKGADDVHAAFIAAGLIDDIMESRIHFNDFA